MEQSKTQQPINPDIMYEEVGPALNNQDEQVKSEQEKISIQYKVVSNDKSRENMKHLLDLKNIFIQQLPKMPKQYIVKLLFDRNHQSMVIMKSRKIIGGTCFRIIETQKLVEIVFLAVTSTEKIKGYGTKLMNNLKEQMQTRNIEYMITYADNLAIGYFRKQGFTKDLKMPQDRWKGYIKDYEGSTMMECFIHPTIKYTEISQNLKKKKQALIKKIKQASSINEIAYQGQSLMKIRSDNNSYTRINLEGIEQTFKVNPELIPGVLQGGWSWEESQQLKKSKQISFQLQCASIIDQMKKHPSSWPFRDPVSPAQVPDYNLVVKQPIDLKTIEKRLITGQYTSKQHFVIDIKRIFTNARIYNQPQTVYYKSSIQLQDFITAHLEKFLSCNDPTVLDIGKVIKGGVKKKGQRK